MKLPGEGNGNPLQYACLENPMDRGAWWAAVHGVAKSWTRLKQLSSSSRYGNGSWLALEKRQSGDNYYKFNLLIFKSTLEGFLGEGNGNPLQYACLENPMDRGAW